MGWCPQSWGKAKRIWFGCCEPCYRGQGIVWFKKDALSINQNNRYASIRHTMLYLMWSNVVAKPLLPRGCLIELHKRDHALVQWGILCSSLFKQGNVFRACNREPNIFPFIMVQREDTSLQGGLLQSTGDRHQCAFWHRRLTLEKEGVVSHNQPHNSDAKAQRWEGALPVQRR